MPEEFFEEIDSLINKFDGSTIFGLLDKFQLVREEITTNLTLPIELSVKEDYLKRILNYYSELELKLVEDPWIQDALRRLITQAEITDKGSENTHMVAVFNIRLVLLNWFIIPGEKVQSIMENFEKIGLWQNYDTDATIGFAGMDPPTVGENISKNPGLRQGKP